MFTDHYKICQACISERERERERERTKYTILDRLRAILSSIKRKILSQS